MTDTAVKQKKVRITGPAQETLNESEDERIKGLADYYRKDINNFSFWYPKVKDCGIKQPRSLIFQLPDKIVAACFEPYKPECDELITGYFRDTVMPEIKEMGPVVFMKNGAFSNKFDFENSCMTHVNIHEMVRKFSNTNYLSECFGAGGMAELVIREFAGNLPSIDAHIPKIYNGMPLRPEFRIFYDFDARQVLYPAFYWDKSYCEESISRNYTDRIVYNACIDDIQAFYEEHKDEVMQMVGEHMKNVDLKGAWSVDIMYEEEEKQYWLIDMAAAQQSAYWDPEKAKKYLK